jgi:hypothetical protein
MSSTMWLWWHHTRAEENFVTEAIALATRVDAGPMARLLVHAGVLDLSTPVTQVDASTQHHVGTFEHGEGPVDLRVLLRQDDRTVEVWLETKVRAPVSDAQLFRYLNAMHHLPRGDRPRLLLLGGRTAACERRYLPWVGWGDVVKAINAADDPIWRELRSYLIEQGLAEENARGG